MLYYGFYFKRPYGECRTLVVTTPTSIIVTSPTFGKGKAKISFTEPGIHKLTDSFLIYATENTDKDFCDIPNVIERLKEHIPHSDDASISIYRMPKVTTHADCLLPIVKNFDHMLEELKDFFDIAYAVSKIDVFMIKDKIDDENKHIVVKKSFDPNFYATGKSYSVNFKGYSDHFRVKKEFYDCLCIDINNDLNTIDFLVLDPGDDNYASKCNRISLTIDEIEMMDIIIRRTYTETEMYDTLKTVNDTYHNAIMDAIGEEIII